MAIGDLYSGNTTLTDSASWIVASETSTQEVVIHNIYIPYGSEVEIYLLDTMGECKILTTTETLYNYTFHINTTHCLRLKNTSGASIFLSFDGVVVNE